MGEKSLSDDNDTPIITDKRKSPEFVARLKAQGFQKGRKKTGGTVAIAPEIKQAMAEKTPEALATMLDLMENSKNPMVRLKAAEYILSPFVSKAPALAQVDHKHTHTIADMLTQINQQRLGSPKTIDLVPVRDEDDV